jgi:putative FmdB family regulatory protein
MPTYEYKCPNGHEFEKFFPTISTKRRVTCPKCKKVAQRLISGGAGLVFKGSGFYITDYKRAGEKPPEGDKPPEPKTEPKSESKSESKSEPKSESKPSKPKDSGRK